MIRGKSKHSVASQCEGESVLFDGQMQKTCVTLLSLTFCQCSPPPGVCVSLHSESNYLLSLFTLKKAPAAVPVGRAWPASRAESGGAARQWEATGRRPEQSAVQLPE